MYFWRVDRLVEDFRNDQVTEKEKLKYMILYGVFYAVAVNSAFSTAFESTYMDAVELLITASIAIFGTYYCYAKNRGGDGRDFVTRFMCIGLPVTVKVAILFLPLFVASLIVEKAYGIGTQTNEFGQSVSYTTWPDLLLNGVLYAVMYLYLAKKMAAVAKVAPASEPG